MTVIDNVMVSLAIVLALLQAVFTQGASRGAPSKNSNCPTEKAPPSHGRCGRDRRQKAWKQARAVQLPNIWQGYVARLRELHAQRNQLGHCGKDGFLKRFNFENAGLHLVLQHSTSLTPRLPFFAETHYCTCNLLPTNGCDLLEQGQEPHRFLLDWIDFVLADCNYDESTCYTLDVGANIGMMSLRMLQNGAYVTAFEPQLDMCCAAEASAKYNGYNQHYCILCSGIAHSNASSTLTVQAGVGFRYGHGRATAAENVFSACTSNNAALQWTSPLYSIRDIVLGGDVRSYQYIKLDTDSLDMHIMRELVDLASDGKITFNAASFEIGNGQNPRHDIYASQLFVVLQKAGYDLLFTIERHSVEDGHIAEQVNISETIMTGYTCIGEPTWIRVIRNWRRDRLRPQVTVLRRDIARRRLQRKLDYSCR